MNGITRDTILSLSSRAIPSILLFASSIDLHSANCSLAGASDVAAAGAVGVGNAAVASDGATAIGLGAVAEEAGWQSPSPQLPPVDPRLQSAQAGSDHFYFGLSTCNQQCNHRHHSTCSDRPVQNIFHGRDYAHNCRPLPHCSGNLPERNQCPSHWAARIPYYDLSVVMLAESAHQGTAVLTSICGPIPSGYGLAVSVAGPRRLPSR